MTLSKVLNAINGGLAGMVAACAGCNNMSQGSAILTGILAGVFYHYLSTLIKKFQIPDLLDAFPVHFGGGMGKV